MCIAGLAGISALPAFAQAPISVREAIETVRILEPPGRAPSNARINGESILISPARSRYAFFTVEGDVEADLNWLTLYSGQLASFESATDIKKIIRLSTTSKNNGDPLRNLTADPTFLTHSLSDVHWLDESRIAFIWPDENQVRQVLTVDLESGERRYCTNSSQPVLNFRFSAKSDSLIYNTQRRRDIATDESLAATGFAVQNADLTSLLDGDFSGLGTSVNAYSADTYFQNGCGTDARSIRPTARGFSLNPPLILSISPDDRFAVVDATPMEAPPSWRHYDDPILQMYMEDLADTTIERAALGFLVKQLYLVDLDDGSARPLLDAPMAPDLVDRGASAAVWSPDSTSLLIGPTFAPDHGFNKTFVRIEVPSLSYVALPLPAPLKQIGAVRWEGKTPIIETIDGRQFVCRHLEQCAPHRSTTPPQSARQTSVHVEVRQGLGRPPAVFAMDRKRQLERQILDLNPGLTKRFALGRVTFEQWEDAQGRKWSGLLYLPTSERPAGGFPLVIQTHGHADPSVFSLYGYDSRPLGPGTSINVAQMLASRGIAVLHIADQRLGDLSFTPEEPKIYVRGYESAIEMLRKRALMNPRKVGISGFSLTGWHVEYALTHSKIEFAAAIVSDNFGGGYIQASMVGWSKMVNRALGAAPFENGLATWLERAPPFSANRVTAPLMLVQETGIMGVVGRWEMFSRLRALQKPVELYVVPDAKRAFHGLQNPRQLLALQSRAVAWFRFWLQGEVDDDPGMSQTTNEWKRMKTIQAAPGRPPSLEWRATPLAN